MRQFVHPFAAIVFATASVEAHGQCSYEATFVFAPECAGEPGDPIGLAINESGQICGRYEPCPLAPERAFIWTPTKGGNGDGTFFTLPLPVGFSASEASDISDDGTIVGTLRGVPDQRAFVFQNGTMTQLPALTPQGWSQATGVNNHGQVVGFRSIGSAGDPVNPKTAFIWSEETGFIDLAPLLSTPSSHAWDIDDNGTVIGNDEDKPFEYRNGVVTYLEIPDGYVGGNVRRIASESVYVGAVYTLLEVSPVPHPAIWINGSVHVIHELPDTNSGIFYSMNRLGEAVGLNRDAPFGSSYLTFWQNGLIHELHDYIGSPEDQFVGSVNDINDRGQIVGAASGPYGKGSAHAAVILTPVAPPPGDVDHNCKVNIDDLTAVILEWGKTESIADLNDNGTVDVPDLVIVIQNWSEG